MENYICQIDEKEKWTQDMKQSVRVFNAHIEEIKQILESEDGPIQILHVEGENNEICRMLDTKAGIDYLIYRKKQDNSYSLASRITKRGPINDFTIRKERQSGAKTEYQKLKNAIKNGLNYPQFILHIHYKEETNKIVSIGIAKTTDIINCIDAGIGELKTNYDKDKWAKYVSLRWDDMIKAGYHVKTYYAA